MGIKIIVKSIKNPRRILSYIKWKTETFYNLHIKKVAPFTHEMVSSDWGIDSAGLPHFTARLYREVKILKEAIGAFHAKRSLEIGCGYGRLTPFIAEHSEQHYAVEPQSVLLEDAKTLYPQVQFYHAKAQKLPFSNNYFDLLVSWTVLQHVPPKELYKVVAEIKRVCTPKSVIILAEAVGSQTKKVATYMWLHTLEDWKKFFSPWKLVCSAERKLEETFKGDLGLVMRFENDDYDLADEDLKKIQ